MISRRTLLFGGSAAASIAAVGLIGRGAFGRGTEGEFEVAMTSEEWREILTPAEYRVLREEGTEPAWSSPLIREKRDGIYRCAGCDKALYSSDAKFESGTGWPSFWDALPSAVGTREDRSYFMIRTEVHCARCGGHLGHIFDDGPKPTGLRHCINGLALVFDATT